MSLWRSFFDTDWLFSRFRHHEPEPVGDEVDFPPARDSTSYSYVTTSSTVRQPDGTLKSWGESKKHAVDREGNEHEMHARRLDDRVRVTRRKKAKGADWTNEADYLQTAPRTQRIERGPSGAAQAAQPEPAPAPSPQVFDDFEKEWTAATAPRAETKKIKK